MEETRSGSPLTAGRGQEGSGETREAGRATMLQEPCRLLSGKDVTRLAFCNPIGKWVEDRERPHRELRQRSWSQNRKGWQCQRRRNPGPPGDPYLRGEWTKVTPTLG